MPQTGDTCPSGTLKSQLGRWEHKLLPLCFYLFFKEQQGGGGGAECNPPAEAEIERYISEMIEFCAISPSD